jgi:hypothetical protein
VYRTGKYQVLPADGIDGVIRRYGGGLTAQSDAQHITLERAGSGLLQSFAMNLGDAAAASFVLEDGDVITVPSLADQRPAVVFEGAVTAGTPQEVPGTAVVPTGSRPGILSTTRSRRFRRQSRRRQIWRMPTSSGARARRSSRLTWKRCTSGAVGAVTWSCSRRIAS